jgi:hypothetical protein
MSCGGPLPRASNHPSSNQEAKAILEKRLKKTNEIRDHLDSVHEGLKPLAWIMRDVSSALHGEMKLEGHPSERFQSLLERLREVIRESSLGIVQFRSDGTWIMERTLLLPLGRKDYGCQASTVEVLGYQKDGSEVLTLSLKDCISPEKIKLLELILSPELIAMTYFPESLDQLIQSGAHSGQCIGWFRKDEAKIHCDPVQVKSNSYLAVMESFDFSQNLQGVSSLIKLTVQDLDGRKGAFLEFETSPGTPKRVSFRRQEL